MHPYTRAFSVHSYEVDSFGELTTPSLAGYLQEVAGNHASALGWSIGELMKQGLTWVLARQRIEVMASIQAGDELEVTTWPSGLDRLAALRDFRVRRERDGLEVARAVSLWYVLDLESRRPVRPERVVKEVRDDFPPHVFTPPKGRLPALSGAGEEKRFRTRYADIDVNQHVNNLSYVAWALESVPEKTWRRQRLAAVDVQFLAECHYGSAVLSRTAGAGPDVFRHAIVREEDGRELARLETDWEPRAGAMAGGDQHARGAASGGSSGPAVDPGGAPRRRAAWAR